VVIGIAGIFAEAGSILRKISGQHSKEMEEKVDAIKLGDFVLSVSDSHGRSEFAGDLSATTANDIDLLKTHIAKVLDVVHSEDLDGLSNLIYNQYRDKFRERLARNIWLELPSPLDATARKRISEMDNRSWNLQEFLERAKQTARTKSVALLR
jgi:hypothetical protein